MGRRCGLPGSVGGDPCEPRPPGGKTRIENPTLRGRLVELRPDERFDPAAGRFGWWLWRLEDMKWMGHASLSRRDEGTFGIGAYILRNRGRYAGGYGGETYRLVCRFAAMELSARKVLADNTDLERKAALEEAGFKLVGAFPPQHGKRRRGYGIRHYEWTP